VPLWNLIASARRRNLLSQIGTFEPILRDESNERLAERCLSLRYRARRGDTLQALLPETFALVREAAWRSVQMRHFDVQLLAGIVLVEGAVAEIETGEGKTLVATLPLTLRALGGEGALLATANDYLAERDAEWMGPVYRMLGLSVGVVLSKMSRDERRRAYDCDITYGTAREFGFDFLRDRLELRNNNSLPFTLPAAAPATVPTASALDHIGGAAIQREPHFILVDEADSLMIDEARTPLIISGSAPSAAGTPPEVYHWCARESQRFEESLHFEVDEERHTIELTPEGRGLARTLPVPDELRSVPLPVLCDHLERALFVQRHFHRDRHYVVREKEVVIVDEFTGRLAEGRRWQGGVHQAVEAREGLPISSATWNLARITVQDFFLRFRHLAGMTGTAVAASRELRKLYRLRTASIATHRPPRRIVAPVRVFATCDEKWSAITHDVARAKSAGRPVLVGTRTIEASEVLSRRLTEAGIEHQVLNARHPEQEAGIVARAGERGRVTVATNMAGRGTDIRLEDGVSELGGLLVIGTEMHESARIDRQLCGRCGRQGDPGEFRQFVALDDELLQMAFGDSEAARIAATESVRLRARPEECEQLTRLFRKAQQLVERRRYQERLLLQHREHRRHRSLATLGQDPYLDFPE
jgi:preprotein translocase subunit SecA